MAKKKNAPVLRDGDNNQPTITKSYTVRDKWLDKAKDNLVEFKSVDGEISDLKVNGEPAGGGGGGGMFTTAKLTAASDNRVASIPYIFTNEGVSTILLEATMDTGDELDIVLVNGTCIMTTRNTVTGAAELLDADQGIYKVTGNVTLS